jgi:uncharacterized glyoxalase superfamily protein PhnB
LGFRKKTELKVSQPDISSVSPVFIVRDVALSLSYYKDQLGFEVTFQQPSENPFFGIVKRGGAMIMLKSVGVDPLPNNTRHSWVQWDAYHYVAQPDALAAEFKSRSVVFSQPLKDTQDNLRGFEVTDPDGYVLFFGRPNQ